MPRMAMGTRESDQPPLWVATSDLPSSPGHPFYTRLNAILEAEGFDRFVEDQCRRFMRRSWDGQVWRPAGISGCY
jgi:transposase